MTPDRAWAEWEARGTDHQTWYGFAKNTSIRPGTP